MSAPRRDRTRYCPGRRTCRRSITGKCHVSMWARQYDGFEVCRARPRRKNSVRSWRHQRKAPRARLALVREPSAHLGSLRGRARLPQSPTPATSTHPLAPVRPDQGTRLSQLPQAARELATRDEAERGPGVAAVRARARLAGGAAPDEPPPHRSASGSMRRLQTEPAIDRLKSQPRLRQT